MLTSFKVLWAGPWNSEHLFRLKPHHRLILFGFQVQSAIDKRAVDVNFLFWVAGGRALCTAVDHLLYYTLVRLDGAVDTRSRTLYWGRIFRSMARLDVPTWNDPAVSSHVSSLSPRTTDPDTAAWSAIKAVVEMGSTFLRLFSEAVVLFRVLQDHGDGALVVLASAASEAVSFIAFSDSITLGESMRHSFLCFP